jgi:Recombinase
VASRRRKRRRTQQQRRLLDTVKPEAQARLTALLCSREQAAELLGISLATLDRRVVPTIATVRTEWGARLIPAEELLHYLEQRRESPRARPRCDPSGPRPTVPPEVVARIQQERAEGASLAEIARQLNRDGVTTGQGGRQWWPSTVRAILVRAIRRPSAT